MPYYYAPSGERTDLSYWDSRLSVFTGALSVVLDLNGAVTDNNTRAILMELFEELNEERLLAPLTDSSRHYEECIFKANEYSLVCSFNILKYLSETKIFLEWLEAKEYSFSDGIRHLISTARESIESEQPLEKHQKEVIRILKHLLDFIALTQL